MRWLALLLAGAVATAPAATVQVRWDAVADARVTGYQVGWGPAPGSYEQIQLATTTGASVEVPDSGASYIAVRTLGEESGQPITSVWSAAVVWEPQNGPTLPLGQVGLLATYEREASLVAISVVQTATGQALGTSFTVTFASPPSSGNKLIAIIGVAIGDDNARTASITDFASDGSQVNAGTQYRKMQVLSKTAGGSEGTTYTVSFTGAAEFNQGVIYELSGVDNDDPYDALTFNSNSYSTPSVTPTVIGVLPIAALVTDNTTELSATGWTNYVSAAGTYGRVHTVRRALGEDTETAYSATWTTGGTRLIGLTMLVKPAAAASLPPVRPLSFAHLLTR